MESKRGTKALRNAGIDNLTVEKGRYGFYLRDPRLNHQRCGIVCDNYHDVVNRAIAGERPTQITKNVKKSTEEG
jgi:hypothetical protein